MRDRLRADEGIADGQRSDFLTVLHVLREERCASGTKSRGHDHRVVDLHSIPSSGLNAGLMKINCQSDGYSTQHSNIRQRLNDFPPRHPHFSTCNCGELIQDLNTYLATSQQKALGDETARVIFCHRIDENSCVEERASVHWPLPG